MTYASGGAETGDAGIEAAVKAIADPTRRSILRLVRDSERAAGDIARQFPQISRPAVSQHLRVLSDAGLVESRSVGTSRLYRARPEGLREMRQFIDEMWSDGLARLKAAAEAEAIAEADAAARTRQRGA